MTESKHTRNIRYYGDNGIVIVEADGDLQCAHFVDFAYVQESVCAYGGTAIDAVANLALTMRDISKAMQAGFNAAPELLSALKACCIATQGKQKAFCECFQHDSRPCLDMEGVCWFEKNGNCHIWRAIQKARGINNEQG